jgi:cell division protein ZapA (FtsZ GTPase activity inhibitor)
MSKILKKYKARIFGEVYTIVSDEDDGFVLDVVHKVDSLMKDLAAKPTMMGDAKKVAVLIALKATEELLSLQQELQQETKHCEKIMMLLNNESDVIL